MKKILRSLGYFLGTIIFLFALFLLFVNLAGIPSYEPKEVEFKVNPTQEKIENGIKLANLVCIHCHRSSNSIRLTGRKVEDMNPEFGLIYSQKYYSG